MICERMNEYKNLNLRISVSIDDGAVTFPHAYDFKLHPDDAPVVLIINTDPKEDGRAVVYPLSRINWFSCKKEDE